MKSIATSSQASNVWKRKQYLVYETIPDGKWSIAQGDIPISCRIWRGNANSKSDVWASSIRFCVLSFPERHNWSTPRVTWYWISPAGGRLDAHIGVFVLQLRLSFRLQYFHYRARGAVYLGGYFMLLHICTTQGRWGSFVALKGQMYFAASFFVIFCGWTLPS